MLLQDFSFREALLLAIPYIKEAGIKKRNVLPSAAHGEQTSPEVQDFTVN
jgi:hypothetical protein